MSIVLECPSCRRKFRVNDEHAARRFNCPSCGRQLPVSQPRLADHDVFISYSAQDKSTADALCVTLEKKGIRCWIAPRDILPGADWGEAIIDAIEHGRLMVLVLSDEANKSPQVKREVERAASKGISIVPFRIENVTLSKSMEYFISAQHWFDAYTPPLSRHLQGLAEALEELLTTQSDRPRVPVPREYPPGVGQRGANPKRSPLATFARPLPLIAAGGSILMGLVMILLIVVFWPKSSSDPQSISRPPETAVQPSTNPIVGAWKLTADSLRILDPQIESIVKAGRVSETLDDARRKFREYRLLIQPMSQPNELRLVSQGRNTTPLQATLSSSDNGKTFEGSAGPFIATVELESPGTLKAKGVPYSLLQDEFAYERAE